MKNWLCLMLRYGLYVLIGVVWAAGFGVFAEDGTDGEVDVRRLKSKVLQNQGVTEAEKIKAVYAIRKAGGRQAEVALLDLAVEAKSARVLKAVVGCLGEFSTESVKLRLASMATDVSVGAYALSQLERMTSDKDGVILKQVLATVGERAALLSPKTIREAIALFAARRYEPAKQFLTEMTNHDDHSVRRAAIKAIGFVGKAEDTGALWRVLDDTLAGRTERAAAARSLGRFGDAEDAKKLLVLADSMRRTVKSKDSTRLLVRDLLASRASILARVVSREHTSLKDVSVEEVAGGVVVKFDTPKECAGVLVRVRDGKKTIAHGFVIGSEARIALTAGLHIVDLYQVMPRSRKGFQEDIAFLSQLARPEMVLETFGPIVLEGVQAKDASAGKCSIINTLKPQALDDYAEKLHKNELASGALDLVLLQSRYFFWPSPQEPLRADPLVPTGPLSRRGGKLYCDAGYLYWHGLGSLTTALKKGSAEEVIVLGQLCRLWDGKHYTFLSLCIWPVDDR